MISLGGEFRVRKTGWGEFGLMEPESEELYFAHLREIMKKYNKNSYDELIAFFGLDFFQDGGVIDVKFINQFRSIIMEIDCPNISYVHNKFGKTYVKSLRFECIFSGVTCFNITSNLNGKQINEQNDTNIGLTIYRSEVDTMHDEIQNSQSFSDASIRSLIIGCNLGCKYIQVVFSDFQVLTKSDMIFDIILNDKKYLLPSMPGLNWA